MSIPLFDLITLKYPNARNIIDFQVGDHGLGNGPEIVAWNLSDPQPSQADLAQWAIDLAPQYTFLQNKLSNQAIYAQLDAIDAKSVRPLRTNDTALLATLETQAAALRAQLLPVS